MWRFNDVDLLEEQEEQQEEGATETDVNRMRIRREPEENQKIEKRKETRHSIPYCTVLLALRLGVSVTDEDKDRQSTRRASCVGRLKGILEITHVVIERAQPKRIKPTCETVLYWGCVLGGNGEC